MLSRTRLIAYLINSSFQLKLNQPIRHPSLSLLPQYISRTYCQAHEFTDEKPIQYEESRDPEEWKYVELLSPIKSVPPPPQATGPTPSGWHAPKIEKINSLPYRVRRTKNHMLPVYIRQEERDLDKENVVKTTIRKIDGDINLLEAEVVQYLESLYPDIAPLPTTIDEPARTIYFLGAYTDEIAHYLLDKGF